MLCAAGWAVAQPPWRFALPEQRSLAIREPGDLPAARLPDVPAPRTVQAGAPAAEFQLSLDDAIRISLDNVEAIRVLAGVTAVASGQTIYSTGIANAGVDEARSRFDPTLRMNHAFGTQDQPQAWPSPAAPGAALGGAQTDFYAFDLGLGRQNMLGGTGEMNVQARPQRTHDSLPFEFQVPRPLDPQTSSALEFRYTQPLLQGGGLGPNRAPLVIAGIETERSFFQTKDAVQETVRGVVEAYWNLVAARVDVWARQQQTAQGREALERAEALLQFGFGHAGEVAQARSALANFQAALVTAQANVLQREDALRNMLGLPPTDDRQLVPVTPPNLEQLPVDWAEILRLAETYRPDIIELKLILEADEQRWLMARNQALPRLDASSAYRWNGLEGRTPDRTVLASGGGQFSEWELGVSFSVPLGLRQSRSQLRQAELILRQDRTNLAQGLHGASHQLSLSVRNLSQFYAQYQAYGEARRAAWANLERQMEDYRQGRPTLYVNVLIAIVEWGNAVNSEAQALLQYNVELADLERQTGTILETHGVRFVEERFCCVGPVGRWGPQRPYPRDVRPSSNDPRYPTGTVPSEESLGLQSPTIRAPGRPGNPGPASRGEFENLPTPLPRP